MVQTNLVGITESAYMKAAGFNSLVNTLHTHTAVHSCTDLMAVISDKLPISTTSVTNEATSLCENMMNEVYNVDNLTPCSFFNDLLGKCIIPAFTFDPATQPANIAYTNFLYQINGNQVNPRIKQPSFNFNFSLHLPQTGMTIKQTQPIRKPKQMHKLQLAIYCEV